ncbi:MAG: hypothetical protein HY928_06105 [Elusimicrobia bacterium]|nr:hypothetical protein [Elusimicrobiota bacterium]
MRASGIRPRRSDDLLRLAGYLLTTALFANLNALVDVFLHPEIPYLDQEHLVVGGISGLAFALLFGLQGIYARRLRRSMDRVAALESFLPICSYCKKIRLSNPDGTRQDSWRPIESYFSKHAVTKLSHGICPECVTLHHPEVPPEAFMDRSPG